MRRFRIPALDRSQWLAASALCAALFSVGLSVSVAAGQGARAEPPGAEPGARARAAAPAGAAQVGLSPSATTASPTAAGKAPAASPPTTPNTASSRGSAGAGQAASAAKAAEPERGRLGVTRFLIASAIEQREPVAATAVLLDAQPVYAFAELDNREGGRRVVKVTFEREGLRDGVGHVELAIPAHTKRWRTWASTRLLDATGTWTAVLRDEQGNELARTPFEVVSLAH